MFNDLEFGPHPSGGSWAVLQFDNGYGVSVIRTDFSYGGREGLWELAVLQGGEVCYNTPITMDVEGWLCEEEVTELMTQVQALPDWRSPGRSVDDVECSGACRG